MIIYNVTEIKNNEFMNQKFITYKKKLNYYKSKFE